MATEKRLDLVEREAVKDAIGFMNLHFLGHGESKSVLDSINEVPSVDAVEVVHGRWTEAEDGDGAVCSVCGEDFCNVYLEVERFLYCPNCGAKMDLKGE